jgi:hypothetical protein
MTLRSSTASSGIPGAHRQALVDHASAPVSRNRYRMVLPATPYLLAIFAKD